MTSQIEQLIEDIRFNFNEYDSVILKTYIERLEQQNTAWADMVEMQSQKIAYLKHNYEMQEIMINDYKQSIAKLQEEKDGLQSLVDFKQQEISVFESSIEGLVIQKSQAYRQGADDVYLLLTGKKVYD